MKIGKKRVEASDAFASSSRPSNNQNKKTVLIAITIVITALLISWVYAMGVKATETVTVIMTSRSIYKNQQITEDMIQAYDMVKAEFEKYAIVDNNGQANRRILLWDERNQILGSFAAYPIQQNVPLEFRSLYKSRVDNSDNVMYSFPGKEILSLDVGTSDLTTFKTFLEPGDRLTVTAIYKEKEDVETMDAYGGIIKESVETYRSEIVFQDIIVADLLNTNGDSVLDIYADYNSRTVNQQAALDASTAFQDSVEPKSLLVALTPEEKDLYYYYLSKSDVEFRISLPQRVE